MKPNSILIFKDLLTMLLGWLGRLFDKTASWVTKLSWWKFILVAVLIIVAGNILQETLFPHQPTYVAIKKNNGHGANSKTITDHDTNIHIDSNGITVRKNPSQKMASTPASAPPMNTRQDGSLPVAPPETAAMPAPPEPAEGISIRSSNGEFHIQLPPEIGREVSDAIDEAVDDAAEQKANSYRKESSTWFINFVLLFVIGLFAIKALMGGNQRATALAESAHASAERESLQRQVSEAKMHMMQAQVEPHFLFNTLASVEYLIETDPPRAAAMQRQLIQYLRAVLPQMRGNGSATTLGREADMVKAYLELLKMRMEERLQVQFQVSEGLRSAAFPPMMLQSLVENAIKHGLEGKPEGGSLSVLAEIVNGKLQVSVSDDGLGFGALPSDGTGLGLSSIRERLKLLHNGQSQLIIAANQPSGVRATIEVPYTVTAS